MKDYMKPEAELIALIAEEAITTSVVSDGDDFLDGETGLESALPGW